MFKKIKDKFADFDRKPVEINPVFAPRQEDIIKTIDFYWMSRFIQGDYNELGQKVPFFNVIEVPVLTAGKMIDIDTKDPRIIPLDGHSVDKALYFEKELGAWMRDTGLGKLFNIVKWMLPKYGTVVIKVFKNSEGQNELKFVPLQNLKSDPTVEKLENSEFVAEYHEYLPRELRAEGKIRNWDKDRVEKVIALNEGQDFIKIWEYYGEIENETGNYFVIAEHDEEDDVIIDKSNVEFPYYELHWDKVDGRWLGIGSVEKNFESQIYMNRIAELKSKSLVWTSKNLFWTPDDNIKGNILDVRDGDILKLRRGLNPIQMEERNLHAYREELASWGDNMRQRQFMSDVLMGVSPKSGVPLGSTMLTAQMGGSFFENKREDYALYIKDILWDKIIPDFKKNNNKEHWLNFVGSNPNEMKRFERMSVESKVNDRVKRHLKDNKRFPDSSTIEMFRTFERDRLKNKNDRWVKIPDSFYDNLKFDFKFTIVGESEDLQAKMNALNIAIQTANNPEEALEYRRLLLQLVGIRPVELEQPQPTATDTAGQVIQQKGSAPATKMPNMVAGMATETAEI